MAVHAALELPLTRIWQSSHFAPQAYSSISSALRHIYVTDGVRGLFQGFSATALRDAPYAGMYMASYEGAKAWLGRSRGTGDPGVVVLSGESLVPGPNAR